MASVAPPSTLSVLANPVKYLYLSILRRVLGDFVQELGLEHFDISIVAGKARIYNLRLKPDALDALKLDLPVRIVDGVLEHLSLTVPYRVDTIYALYYGTDLDVGKLNMPVQLSIHGIRVTLQPRDSFDDDTDPSFDAVAVAAAVDAAIKRKIASVNAAWEARMEARLQRTHLSGDDATSDLGERLVAILMQSLRVTVKRVHLQYEDAISEPSSPFQIGLLLNQLSYGPCSGPCCQGNVAPATSVPVDATAGMQSAAGGAAADSNGSNRGTPRAEPASPTSSSSASNPSFEHSGNSHVRFKHNSAHWSGLFVYINALSASEVTPVGDGNSAPTAQRSVPSQLLEWAGLNATTLQLVVNDVSGAIRVAEQLSSGSSSADDPPQLSVEAHIEGLHLSLIESQLKHVRSIWTYARTVQKFARYRRLGVRPPRNKHQPFLSSEQAVLLRLAMEARQGVSSLPGSGQSPASDPASAKPADITADPSSSVSHPAAAAEEEDPYLQLSDDVRQAVRDRARTWWRWAIACVRHDIQSGINAISSSGSGGEEARRSFPAHGAGTSLREALKRVEQRECYIRLFRQLYGRLHDGQLLVPASTLPGFSIVSNTGDDASPKLLWVCDVPPLTSPAQLVDMVVPQGDSDFAVVKLAALEGRLPQSDILTYRLMAETELVAERLQLMQAVRVREALQRAAATITRAKASASADKQLRLALAEVQPTGGPALAGVQLLAAMAQRCSKRAVAASAVGQAAQSLGVGQEEADEISSFVRSQLEHAAHVGRSRRLQAGPPAPRHPPTAAHAVNDVTGPPTPSPSSSVDASMTAGGSLASDRTADDRSKPGLLSRLFTSPMKGRRAASASIGASSASPSASSKVQ